MAHKQAGRQAGRGQCAAGSQLRNHYYERAREAEAEVARLREENAHAREFLERRGYRRCDIAACNCQFWHGGHAEDRLREISERLSDVGVPSGTIFAGVNNLIERAEAAEARLTALEGAIRAKVAEHVARMKQADANHDAVGANMWAGIAGDFEALLPVPSPTQETE